MTCDLDNTLPEWLMQHPETEQTLIELGLDPTCGGKSLEYQCRQNDFDPYAVLRRLQKVIQENSANKRDS